MNVSADSFFSANKITKILPWLFALGLTMYVVTAATNLGFIALDDYESGIAPVVPAQNQVVSQIIAASDFRSPIPSLTLLSISKFAYALGVTDPASQFRLVLVVLAVFSFLTNAICAAKIFRLAQPAEPVYRAVVLFLVGFYFLCPLFMTRPLIEAMSAPFITASAYFACRYYARPNWKSLTSALLFVTLASVYRFQAGVCAIALALTVVATGRWKDLCLLFGGGLFLFGLTGAVDGWMKGAFHYSLIAYVKFNLAHSSTFGTPPFYMFALLFLGLSIPPVFLTRYRHLNWVKEYLPILPAVLYFAVFVGSHSLVPHKEERFMVPILPVYLILLTPLATYLLTSATGRWRWKLFVALNFVLLAFASFNVPQNNIVGLARYLHYHPAIKTITGVEDTLVLFPQAFVLHPVKERKLGIGDLAQLSTSCDEAVAVRRDIRERAGNALDGFRQLAAFQPGFLEAIAVKLNPRNNARRGAIELLTPSHCSF